MSKGIATPKVTSGGGYFFEDKVAAYYAVQLLNSIAPFDPSFGHITKIQFQVRQQGWLLDDILITLKSSGGSRECAVSVKSNRQFGKDSAPSEFVGQAWEQFLHEGTEKFERMRDLMVLITAPLDQKIKSELDELIQWAQKQDSKTFIANVRGEGTGNELKRKLLESFQCPAGLTKIHAITEEMTTELIKCCHFSQFDFEADTSDRLREAIQSCRSMLQSNSLDEAESLWESLLAICNDYRINAGQLDAVTILDKIRFKFKLKEYPNHRSDWDKLLSLSKNNVVSIQDKIGGKVHLERSEDIAELQSTASDSDLIVLLGPSGVGKTVIAKSLALKNEGTTKVLWWKADSFDVKDFTEFESHLQLNNPLDDLFLQVGDSTAFIIIDGINRIFRQNTFENITTLIHKLRIGVKESPWRVILTCQSEDWERVQYHFLRNNVPHSNWRELQIKEPSIEQLELVWQQFPQLRVLSLRHHLHRVIFKPKILDLLASRASKGDSPDVTRWVGESDLIRWFWDAEVVNTSQGPAKSRFLMLLAEKQAALLQGYVPIHQFTVSELEPLSDLTNQKICRQTDERVNFYHDILGDWTRFKILLSNQNNLKNFLETQLDLPLWHRALRLYGLHLLEQSQDIKAWKEAFDSFASSDGGSSLAQDLLLESVIFAANPLPLLERLWPVLKENNGFLFNRLLGRFLFVATFPDPVLIKLARSLSPDAEVYAASKSRIPYWPYWIPLLNFLNSHEKEVVQLSVGKLATIFDLWLRSTSKEYPMRIETGKLSIALAERELGIRMSNVISIDKKGVFKTVLRAALAACHEHHDEVVNLALIASGRRESNGRILEETKRLNEEQDRLRRSHDENKPVRKPKSIPFLGSFFDEGELQSPWSDGPTRRVDDSFQEACLNSDALHPLILSDPEVAAEVLLALLIKEPVRVSPYYTHPLIEDQLSVENPHQWFPAFYTRGPFLFFLISNPKVALNAIIRLVNFATERWGELASSNGHEIPYVELAASGSSKKWIGNFNIYYSYRDYPPCPHSVVSALMAVEKWFYQLIEAKADIRPYVEIILEKSSTVAFAGVLSAIGRKDPSLLRTELRFLLSVPEFYNWELAYSLKNHDYLMMGWHDQGQESLRMAREWYNLKHRSITLGDYATWLYLNDKTMRKFFDSIRTEWQKRMESLSDVQLHNYLETLIAQFNVNNYKIEKIESGEETWVFQMPEELEKKRKDAIEESSNNLTLIQFPVQCRQLLNQGKPLRDDQLEALWETMQRISSMEISKDPNESVVSVEDAICGGAAVLFILNRAWIEKHIERKEWCVTQLERIFKNPPMPNRYDSEMSISDWGWDSFCAELVPVLWSEDQNSLKLRRMVGLLALDFRYKTIEILFSSSAKLREKLGDSFKQLQNFFLEWASFKFQQTAKSMGMDEKEMKKVRKETNEWINKQIERFMSGDIKSDALDIEKVLLAERPWNIKLKSEQTTIDYNIDRWMIKSAFSWMSQIDHAIDNNERNEWIAFWKKILDATLKVISVHRDERGDIDGTPDDWDRWVFDNVALLIKKMRTDERPEQCWQRILDLGSEGHYWVEDFLTSWIVVGFQNGGDRETFIKHWGAMLDYVTLHDKWNPKSNWYRYDLEDIWIHILGFDAVCMSLWTSENKTIVDSMDKYIERWAEMHLKRPRIAISFTRFLECDAAVAIRLNALTWLETASNENDEEFWSEERMNDRVASVLEVCWRTQSKDLQSNQKAFTSFKRLLRTLGDRQNMVALQLLDQISQVN